MSLLPVDAILPRILDALAASSSLVVEAPPGAGKTTRIPPALLPLTRGEVWVLEPRRLAARLAARRVAEEQNEPLGETVGYQVRFEQVSGPRTRLRYLTEGVLTRRILSDPTLRDAGIVILDEFHERHLDTDLALSLLRRLQTTSRPDLKLLVMSATLDAAPIAGYLGQCPTIRSEGRLFPTGIRYRPHSSEPLEDQVRAAVESLLAEPDRAGDILVFLPGSYEIQRSARALEAVAARRDLLIAPLYGELSPEEQDRAVRPAPRRKVILSTNVAESSITIEGVTAVVDSGLARIAAHSPWSGLPVLRTGRISQASAIQRAGRAARTAPGRVIRLYTEEDFLRRPPRELPEIEREDLSEIALTLKALGVPRFDDIAWLEPPPTPAVEAAEVLLAKLGAVDSRGLLTSTGKSMARCPLPPRLARLVLEAQRRGVGDEGALAAALLSLGTRLPSEMRHRTSSDVFALMENNPPAAARRLVASIRSAMHLEPTRKPDEDALRFAVFAAFPDRIARKRRHDELLLSGGDAAVLAASSTVRDAEFLVAIDIEERKERGLPLVRLASAIEPDWLIDLYPEKITERSAVEWNRAAERVESDSALFYEGLVIEESRTGAPDPIQAAGLLAAEAREAGLARFLDIGELHKFLHRVRFASAYSPLPALTEDDALSVLESMCAGQRSFAALQALTSAGGLLRQLELRLGPNGPRLLEEVAPARFKLPSGRTAPIEYPPDQPPRLAARLQEFFGMKDTPRIARGQVPLVLLLLAPSMRPVQTTSDLPGFWQRWYPQIRKELMRRYPKHKWPEHPEVHA
ncbi:MAG: ATP-dependent helicase HrpB [Bryobacterales bacterium]|nr:ATP-dependent helicase HrpB [Bryobacterales bacterium]